MSRVQHRVSQLYGLSIVFAVLFVVSWIGHIIAEWNSFTQVNSALGLSTSLPNFFLEVMSHTLENWQSDFLQAFTMVTLGAWLIHKNSSQSKDTQNEIKATVERIESRLDAIETNRAQRS
jgi:hypothetical protein